MATYDFGDGNGPVPASQQPNGGGWVAATAACDSTVFVELGATVFGTAKVTGTSKIYGSAKVYGQAQINNTCQIYGSAQVYGTAILFGDVQVYDTAQIFGNAQVGNAPSYPTGSYLKVPESRAQIFGAAMISGYTRITGECQIFGNAQVLGYSIITENAQVGGYSVIQGYSKIAGNAYVIGDAHTATTPVYSGVGTLLGGATTTQLALGNLALNGVNVGASAAGSYPGQAGASALQISIAINTAAVTGITAAAVSNTYTGVAPAGYGIINASSFSINGVTVYGAIANGLTIAGQGVNVAAAITLACSATTSAGVTAAADINGVVTLTATDGRDIIIAGTITNTGLTVGTYHGKVLLSNTTGSIIVAGTNSAYAGLAPGTYLAAAISAPGMNQSTTNGETWTITSTSPTVFSVTGSISGVQASATVGVAYNNGIISFTITSGGQAITVGATGTTFTFSTTSLVVQGQNSIVQGCPQILNHAFIDGNARVYGNATVRDNCLVSGDSQVYDYAIVSGTASVFGSAKIHDNAHIYETAQILGRARIKDNAQIHGTTIVQGHAVVGGVQNISSTTIEGGTVLI